MNTYRKNAVIAGALFLIGFAGIFIMVFAGPILNDSNHLGKAAENANQLTLGGLFQLIMALACSGIAIWLYPVLKRHDEALALWSVGFRMIEAMLFVIAAIGLLSLLSLSQDCLETGTLDVSYSQTLGNLILAVHDWSEVLGLTAWSLGALMYHYIFYQSKLVPRWLSTWGLVGVPLVILAGMLIMFRLTDSGSTVQALLNLPLGLQEIPLAIWLIVKGFNPSAIGSGTA
jgi:hypothetical protein